MPVPEGVETLTLADVEKGDGKDGNPLMTTVNGKVLRHSNLWSVIEQGIKSNKAKGIHSYEVLMGTFLYDPKYGVVKSQDDITKEYAACIEDQICQYVHNSVGESKTEVVGLINLPYKD